MPPRRPPAGGSGENPNTDIRQRRPARDDRDRAPEDDRDDEDAPGGRASTRGSYRTGPEYPAADEDALPPSDEDAPDLGDRDIYGEDDPLPDDPDAEVSVRESGEENPDATRAGPPRKIVIIAGPDKGKSKRFTGVRLVVGRTSSCNVHLSDNSVSRRHLELVQGANGVLLRDLGSGNGTKVNGERVNERLLKHEDVIEIGQTKLQFVDEVEAIRLMREQAEKREEEEKHRQEEEQKKKAEAEAAQAKASAEGGAAGEGGAGAEAGGAAAAAPEAGGTPAQQVQRSLRGLNLTQKVGLGIAGGAVLFVLFLILPALFRPPPPPPPPAKQVLAAKKMELARVAYNEERYQDVLDLVEVAERLWPGSDADGYGARAQNELTAIKALGEARAALEQQHFEDVRKALAQVPEAASAKRLDEKKKLEAELAQQEEEYLARTAEDALDALEVDAARQAIQQLPPDKRKAYEARLVEAEKKAREHQKEEAEEASRERKVREQHAKDQRRQQLDAAFGAVGRKLNGEDFERAVLECDRVLDANQDSEVRQRAISLKRLIPSFANSWEDGQRKYNAHALESAIRPLKKAHELYQQIHLLGTLEARINDELVESLIAGGKAAMLRNDLGSAAVYYHDASAVSPGDDAARAGLERIAQRADDLYLEAYMIRDRDPKESIAKLKLVMQVAPKGSPAYEKAKAQLAARQP